MISVISFSNQDRPWNQKLAISILWPQKKFGFIVSVMHMHCSYL